MVLGVSLLGSLLSPVACQAPLLLAELFGHYPAGRYKNEAEGAGIEVWGGGRESK